MDIKNFLNSIFRTNIARPAGIYSELLNRGAAGVLGALDPRKSAQDYLSSNPNQILTEEELLRFEQDPLRETGKSVATTAANALAFARAPQAAASLQPFITKGGSKLLSQEGLKMVGREGAKNLPQFTMAGFGASEPGQEAKSTLASVPFAFAAPVAQVGISRAGNWLTEGLKNKGQALYQAGKGIKTETTPGGVGKTMKAAKEAERITQKYREGFNAQGINNSYERLTNDLTKELSKSSLSYDRDDLVLEAAKQLAGSKNISQDRALNIATSQVDEAMTSLGLEGRSLSAADLARVKALFQDTAFKVKENVGLGSIDRVAQAKIHDIADKLVKGNISNVGNKIYSEMSTLHRVAPDIIDQANKAVAASGGIGIGNIPGLRALIGGVESGIGDVMRRTGGVLAGDSAIQQLLGSATQGVRQGVGNAIPMQVSAELSRQLGSEAQPLQGSTTQGAFDNSQGVQGDIQDSQDDYVEQLYNSIFGSQSNQAGGLLGGGDYAQQSALLTLLLASSGMKISEASAFAPILLASMGVKEQKPMGKDEIGLATAENMIGEIENALEGITLSGTEFGAATGGRLATAYGKAIPASQQGQYLQLRTGVASRLARALGEVGVLTDKDIERAVNLLPTLEDTPQSAKSKIERLRRLLGETRALYGVYGAGTGESQDNNSALLEMLGL